MQSFLHTHLDLHQVYRLHESWLGSELAGVQDPTSCGNNLSSAAVDGVCVQCHVMNVKADCAHVLLTQSALRDRDTDCMSKNLSNDYTDLLIQPLWLLLTSLVAHWKPATTLSLISLRYWTPFVMSISRLAPVPSGPKHQIFLASVTSHSYFSAR